MKIIIFVLTLVFLLKANARENNIEEKWLKFKQQYGKIYSYDLENQRFEIFKKNIEYILKHNEDYKQGISLYKLEINELADLQETEIEKYFMGLQTKEENEVLSEFSLNEQSYYLDTAPESIDWRLLGAVTEVKKQSKCGSCWAFSAVGSLEGQNFLKTGQLIELSEQNLIDCVMENNGCNGGAVEEAFKYIQLNGGIDTESTYPYVAQQHECEYNSSNIGSNVREYVRLNSINETVLKNVVAFVGPLSVVIKAFPKSFHYYKQGIYNDPECNEEHHSRHAVTAVGYGSENGVDYWILKNSWGPDWGESGYMRLIRNQNNFCEIGKHCSYPLV